MTRPELVVFDCDGVLVDTERLTVGRRGPRPRRARLADDRRTRSCERWMGKSSAAQLADLEAHLGPDGAREFDERTTAELHETFDRELTAIDGVVGAARPPRRAGRAHLRRLERHATAGCGAPSA